MYICIYIKANTMVYYVFIPNISIRTRTNVYGYVNNEKSTTILGIETFERYVRFIEENRTKTNESDPWIKIINVLVC